MGLLTAKGCIKILYKSYMALFDFVYKEIWSPNVRGSWKEWCECHMSTVFFKLHFGKFINGRNKMQFLVGIWVHALVFIQV